MFEITDEMVEAAARALWAQVWSTPWDRYSVGRPPASDTVDDLRAVPMRQARIALTAAREAR